VLCVLDFIGNKIGTLIASRAENADFSFLNQRKSAFSPALAGGARVSVQSRFFLITIKSILQIHLFFKNILA
jgi:hypothetical protein